jgi:3-oxoacyl-[acyl-carrier protein] reductase
MMLKDRTALVLGAVKGIGRAIGLALAAEGVRLVLTRYDWEDSFQEMEDAFRASGADYQIITINLLQEGQIQELAGIVKNRFGKLDILINNIERGGWPAVHGPYIQEQWDLELATTLRAKRWVFDAMFPLLKKSGDAVVINFSSIAGMIGRTGPAALVFNDGYAAASAGVFILTQTWARMGAPGVRVNELRLGFVESRHAQGTRGWETVLTDEEKQAIIRHTLVGRTGRLDDVTKAVLFMIKDAPFMTGSVLCIDGGYLLGGEPVPPMPSGVL